LPPPPPPLILLTSPLPLDIQGKRICSSFGRQKVERGLLLFIHILLDEELKMA
jgi:hypothetical protein